MAERKKKKKVPEHKQVCARAHSRFRFQYMLLLMHIT